MLRATPDALAEMDAVLARGMAAAPDCSLDALEAFDEQFREGAVQLTGDAEMVRSLQHINARIRFMRWIDMRGRRGGTQDEHRAILDMIKAGDVERGCERMERHVQRRPEQIVEAVREAYARISMGEGP